MAPYNESVSASDVELPVVLSRAEHTVSRSDIDINAIKVLYRLHHGGYKSYMVGGAVRHAIYLIRTGGKDEADDTLEEPDPDPFSM